jgi:nucleoside-diphosphate-sugar epimerase
MSKEQYLVTGATGCIGAWVVKELIAEGKEVWAVSRNPANRYRIEMIMSDEDVRKIHFIACDISDFNKLDRIVEENGITHIIHLAALQLPFCAADPILGAQVNVVGHTNVFETALRHGIRHLAYSSSTAVYGKTEEYGTDTLTEELPLKPASHYGVYKQANEDQAKVYWNNNGLPSIGLRPYVAYGPGRDQGMTSTPTKAVIAAILEEDYHITFGGSYCLQYAQDIAKVYIQAAKADIQGYRSYNIGGYTVTTEDVIAELIKQVPAMEGRISFEDKVLPFPPKVDNAPLEELLGKLEFKTLEDGIRESIDLFIEADRRGLLNKEMLK